VAPGPTSRTFRATTAWAWRVESPGRRRRWDKLYALLSERHIPLSVGVYPWPQQLLYDSENSRQVTIWRDWRENKCRLFFNHFSALFEYKRRHPDFLRDLFIWGDSHYTARGNETIARDLIAQHR